MTVQEAPMPQSAGFASGTSGTTPSGVDNDAFELLLKDLAVDFTRAPAERVDDEIERWLQRIVEHFDADRSTIAEPTPTGLLATHSWARDGYQLALGRSERTVPWLVDRITRGEWVIYSRPEELPPEAVHELEIARLDGIRSHVSVPLMVSGRSVGLLGLAFMRHECPWVEQVVRRVQLIALVIASALARKHEAVERRQMIAALAHAERVASMSTLASSFTHELNQPLTASLTNAESALRLLKGGHPPDEIREALEDIAADNRRAGDIVRELRGYLRKHALTTAPVDMAELVSSIARFILPEARTRAVRLAVDVPEGLPRARIDRVPIQQVLVNLLLNAFHAIGDNPAGSRNVAVTVERPRDGRITIAVSDSGPGVPESMQKRLFVPFTTTKPDGMGLGLAICQTIAMAHGAPLTYRPAPEGGARFVFSVPVAGEARGR